MQTNKEFLDTLDLRPEDGFLAVAVRRAAAWQLGKPVVELETETVGEPDFLLGPWDRMQLLFRIESELQCTLSESKTPLPGCDGIPLDWFRGPAIKMPMGEWTKITVEQFLTPIRHEIQCPENWTPFEAEDLRPTGLKTWIDGFRLNFFMVLYAIPVLLILFALPGCVFHDWAQKVSKLSLLGLILWPWFLLVVFKIDRFFFQKRDQVKMSLKEPVSKLLGTLTFQADKLYFFDEKVVEGEITILPGDYRFFLLYGTEDFDWPSYAVMTNRIEIPEFDSVLDIITEQDNGMAKENIQVVVDSGLIGFSDTVATDKTLWKPGPDSKTVKEVYLRKDRTVGGLKLYPSYVDGDYRVYVHKDKAECDVVIELIAPEE